MIRPHWVLSLFNKSPIAILILLLASSIVASCVVDEGGVEYREIEDRKLLARFMHQAQIFYQNSERDDPMNCRPHYELDNLLEPPFQLFMTMTEENIVSGGTIVDSHTIDILIFDNLKEPSIMFSLIIHLDGEECQSFELNEVVH